MFAEDQESNMTSEDMNVLDENVDERESVQYQNMQSY